MIAAIIAGVAIQVHRNTLGWITLIGKDTLQIEADGATSMLTLRPGAMELCPASGNAQFAQFVITDGNPTARRNNSAAPARSDDGSFRRRDASRAERKRSLRKNIPVAVEHKTVTPEQLPDGYTLDDFRKLGAGRTLQRVEHVREHLIIQQFVLEPLISKDGSQLIPDSARRARCYSKQSRSSR